MFSAWFAFVLDAMAKTPILAVAVVCYPIGCAVGIYWTQGLKRAQRRRKWGSRDYLTGFELRGISSCISAVVITLMAKAFYGLPNDQTLVHAILGGSLAPALMWAFLGVLGAMATKFPGVAAFRDAVKTGDRRTRQEPPPPGGDRRSPDDTGDFWAN
jgi:hypothetical protein